jgi:hypothetical protein
MSLKDRIRSFLSGWALFDARQVLMIVLAIGGLLVYAYMSGGWR